MKIFNDPSLYAGAYQAPKSISSDFGLPSSTKEDDNKSKGADLFGAIVAQSSAIEEKPNNLKYTVSGIEFKGKAEVEAELKAKKENETTQTASQEFLEFMDKTPAERMREQLLGGMGLTEESLAALPPEERKKIEEKIAAIIRQGIEDDIKENQSNAEAIKNTQPSVPPHSQTSVDMNKQILSVQESALNDAAFEDRDQGMMDVSGIKGNERKRFEELLKSAIDL